MKSLLIVGCGDIALRALPQLTRNFQVFGLVRAAGQADRIAALGAKPISGDLDDPPTLKALVGVADLVLHLAPPGDSGERDQRTENLIAALAVRPPERLVYISTSGVYGDCGGAWVDEDRPVAPQTLRGTRRVDAERALLAWGKQSGVAVAVLRVPGIYAAERLPLAQLKRGAPVMRAEDDVYTNHIHADDLAGICQTALERAAAGRIYNASDDSEMKMGDYFDLVADRAGLPRPPRITRAAAEAGAISEGLLSFMRESRRLINTRMKEELGVRLRYPSVYDGVPTIAAG
ncbi:MAG: SDR family oxidoreductase [Burkholderiales bacterium]|nr:SDR family oxidoreductase [Burkholderiales bacterium]